jgi:hypothetical protein
MIIEAATRRVAQEKAIAAPARTPAAA